MGEDYDYSYTQDRELSWLKFNERVLMEAGKTSVPIFERLKFLEIFINNLDEFFMVRVGSIYEMSLIRESHRDIRSNLTPDEQLKEIAGQVQQMCRMKDRIYEEVSAQLEDFGVKQCGYADLNEDEKRRLKQYFEVRILPILSPIVIGKQHPFPHIQNKALYVGLLLKGKSKQVLGLIPLPKEVDRMIFLNKEKTRFILAEEVIEKYCDDIFENYSIEAKTILCVTRSADINPDDEMYETTDDYREHMKQVIRMRTRLKPIRLEFYKKGNMQIQKYLMKKLDISQKEVYMTATPLNMKYVYDLIGQVPKDMQKEGCYRPFRPAVNRDIIPGESVTAQVLQEDKLLSFPFDSMDTFVQLLKESASDKETLSIKITIYRLAKHAQIVKYLCEAAENGKEVLVLMELRARFDEENNINYSEILEEAGCQVIYGIEDYKVHSKVCLITKKNGKGIYYITQVGTGNYNESTSKIYTDLSLLTASKQIGQDATKFFHNISVFNLNGKYEHLLVAPSGLKDGIIHRIQREKMKAESFQPAGIFMKMNSLTDRQVIDALSEASRAGVQIFLLIRGICCLRPGIPGKTENIRVESIVGRFLEHSRIYSFGVGEEMEIYISSADMMTRNTKRRVEIACPIYDLRIKKRILDLMVMLRKDNVQAMVLQPDGTYVSKEHTADSRTDSQKMLLKEAKENQQSPKPKKKHIFDYMKHVFGGEKNKN